MPFSWLFFWRRAAQRDPPRATHARVRLYTRAGCHLCDDAFATLAATQARWGFALETVDVDTDAKLVELYGESVPVVCVNDRVRFRGAVNPVLLERLLRAEAGRSTRTPRPEG